MILPGRRATKVIEGQIKSTVDVGLDCVLLVTKAANILACGSRAELGRRAVFVGPADEQYFGTRLPAKACMHICGQERADKVAKMFDAIDVGDGAGDEIAGHRLHPSARTPNPKKQKPSRQDGRAWVRHMSRADAR